jgi:hypothetical protein
MVQSIEGNGGEDSVQKFPGPLTLFPARKKWSNLVIGSGFFTIISILMSFRAGIIAILVTAIFGVGTVTGATMLLPGASSWRLDENGFDITRCFRKQRYRWSEVSDFGIWGFLMYNRYVVFKAAKSHLSILEKMNAGLAGGRNGYLPDTYGMAADDLVQLMTSWRNSAMNATK